MFSDSHKWKVDLWKVDLLEREWETGFNRSISKMQKKKN